MPMPLQDVQDLPDFIDSHYKEVTKEIIGLKNKLQEIEAIEKYFTTPKRDDSLEPMMFVARSFDVNKPGTEIEALSGGVLGGSLKQGKLKVGDEIELRPGYMIEEKNKKVAFNIMFS